MTPKDFSKFDEAVHSLLVACVRLQQFAREQEYDAPILGHTVYVSQELMSKLEEWGFGAKSIARVGCEAGDGKR